MNVVRAFAAALLLASPLAAQEPPHPVSATIAAQGLAVTEAELAARADPDAAERAALGAVRFLGAVEAALQARWAHGLDGGASGLPLMRVPLPPNPAAPEMPSGLVADLFRNTLGRMADVDAALAGIGGDEVTLTLDLGDVWFDVDCDGRRHAGGREDLMGILPVPPEAMAPIVRFDRADVDWLSAYADLLSATAHVVLAFDPTEAIGAVRGATPERPARVSGFADWADYVAIFAAALAQDPDPQHVRAARDHVLAMIAHNRDLWIRVAAETDDRAEFIPNDDQTSALGLPFPAGTGAQRLAVLTDVERALTGELLIPHVLVADDAGIDLAAWIADPGPVDPIGWLHGYAAAPYVRVGEPIDRSAWFTFQDLVGRREAFLFAALLN